MTTTTGSDTHARTTPPARTVRTKSGRVVPVTKSMIASAQAQVSIAKRLKRTVPELVTTISLMR